MPMGQDDLNISTNRTLIRSLLDSLYTKIFDRIENTIKDVELEDLKKAAEKLDERIKKLEEKMETNVKNVSFNDILIDVIIPSLPILNVNAASKVVTAFINTAAVGTEVTVKEIVKSGLRTFLDELAGNLAQKTIDFGSNLAIKGLVYDSPVQRENFFRHYNDFKTTLNGLISSSDQIKPLAINDKDPSQPLNGSMFTEIMRSPNIPPGVSQIFEKFNQGVAYIVDDFLSNAYKMSENLEIKPLTLGLNGYNDIKYIVNEIKRQVSDLKDEINKWVETINDPYWLLIIMKFIEQLTNYNNFFKERLFEDQTKKFIRAYKYIGWFDGHYLFSDQGENAHAIPSIQNKRIKGENMYDDYETIIINDFRLYNAHEWVRWWGIFQNDSPVFSAYTKILNYSKTISFQVVQNEDTGGLYYALIQYVYTKTKELGQHKFEDKVTYSCILIDYVASKGKKGNALINKLIYTIIKNKYQNNFRQIPSKSREKIVKDGPEYKLSEHIIIYDRVSNWR